MFVGNRVALAALLPMVVAGLLLSYLFVERAERNDAQELQRAVAGAAGEIELFLQANIAAAESSASTIAQQVEPPAKLRRELPELLRSRRPYLLRMLVLDASGRIATASPAGAPALPELMPDPARPESRVLLLTRSAGGRPTLGLSAPILDKAGGLQGAVQMEVALPRIELAQTAASRAVSLRLLDRHGTAVALTDAPAPDGEAPVLHAEQALSHGLVLAGRQPVQAVGLQEWGEYAVAASMLLLASLVSWLVAQAVAHQVAKPLDRLAREVSAMHLEDSLRELSVPEQAPREIRTLFGEFNGLLQRLKASYQELRDTLEESQSLRKRMEHLIEERDEIIRRRTSDLQRRSAQLERANAALERVANEDGLTGLANRRAFDEFVALVWRLSLREHVPVALVLLDVDCFKAYNDRYGHPAGDECLRQVAQAVRGLAKRPLDLVARYGGEEFAIVLGRTALAGAADIAETMRHAVESLRIVHEGGIGGIVTVSIGIAALVADENHQCDDLVAEADRCLYQAKNKGRNRIEYRELAS